MTIAPAPGFPEDPGNQYERKFSPASPGGRGPLRFEEGLATDSDVPDDFRWGMTDGYGTAPGRINHNQNVYEKWPEQTMRERAHVGSAAWVEAPDFLTEFAQGSFTDYADVRYEEVMRSGGRYERRSPTVVND